MRRNCKQDHLDWILETGNVRIPTHSVPDRGDTLGKERIKEGKTLGCLKWQRMRDETKNRHES